MKLIITTKSHLFSCFKLFFISFVVSFLFVNNAELYSSNLIIDESPIYQGFRRALPGPPAPPNALFFLGIPGRRAVLSDKKEEELPLLGDPIRVTNYNISINDFITNDSCFQINVHGSSFSTREYGKIYDYYHIALDGFFSPGQSLTQNVSHYRHKPRPIFAHFYEISAKPMLWLNNEWCFLPPHGPVYILKSSPNTIENQTSYTSSVEIGIEGNIGYSGIPDANANVHLNLTHSRERAVKDLNIYSEAQSGGHHAKWIYEFNNLAVENDIGNALSHSCFQPYVQWLWRVDRAEASQENKPEIKAYHKFCDREGERANDLFFSFAINLKGTFSPVKKIHRPFKNKEAKICEADTKCEELIKDKLVHIRVPPEPVGQTNTQVY